MDWNNSNPFISRKPKNDDGGQVFSAKRGVLLSANTIVPANCGHSSLFHQRLNRYIGYFPHHYLWRQGCFFERKRRDPLAHFRQVFSDMLSKYSCRQKTPANAMGTAVWYTFTGGTSLFMNHGDMLRAFTLGLPTHQWTVCTALRLCLLQSSLALVLHRPGSKCHALGYTNTSSGSACHPPCSYH